MSTATPQPATSPPAPSAAAQAPAPNRKRDVRRLILAVVIAVGLVVALVLAAPYIWGMLNTISTDDAYVNGHVTFVAARVPGQVTQSARRRQQSRSQRGHCWSSSTRSRIEFQVRAAKRPWLKTPRPNLIVAQDEVRAMVAQARANRFKLEHAIEDVNNQIALLRANVAALESRSAACPRQGRLQTRARVAKTARRH